MLLKGVFCADQIIIDAQSGRVSCINLIDDVMYPQFPVFVSQFAVMGVFTREQGDLDENNVELLIRAGEQEIARGPMFVNFQGLQTARAVVSIAGLVIPQPGTLTAAILLEGEDMGSWEVNVQLLQAQNQQALEPQAQ